MFDWLEVVRGSTICMGNSTESSLWNMSMRSLIPFSRVGSTVRMFIIVDWSNITPKSTDSACMVWDVLVGV